MCTLVCSIVFANKSVFAVYHFHHPYALTLVHTLTTFLGMYVFAAMGMYERKSLPIRPLLSLAAAFVGYIVFWNISLQVSRLQLARRLQSGLPDSNLNHGCSLLFKQACKCRHPMWHSPLHDIFPKVAFAAVLAATFAA